MLSYACTLFWLAAIAVCQSHVTTTDSTKPTTTSAATHNAPASATCQSRSINYLTHNLPQQCLHKAAWTTAGQSPEDAAPTPAASGIDIEELKTVAQDLGERTASSTVAAAQQTESFFSATSAGARPVDAAESSWTASPDPVQQTRPAEADASNDIEAETDSPLDNAKFLSFEEWKKESLARSGQSPEIVGHGRAAAPGNGQERRRPDIDNALEGLGDDAEIEINFRGFGGSPRPVKETASGSQGVAGRAGAAPARAADALDPSRRTRSKDAGKTCKERFNYASFDCAANILKTNAKCKSSSSVLVENKDSYMLNECSMDNKFIIVELCEDILIDTVVLANFEFFSSMFRHFRVSVSDRYPVKIDRWRELGTFEARNSREIQAFLIENPLIFARYMRVEFLSHYGSEYYCPLSLLRVHGMTMMDQFRIEERLDQGEVDHEEESLALTSPEAPAQQQVEVPVPEPSPASNVQAKPEVVEIQATTTTSIVQSIKAEARQSQHPLDAATARDKVHFEETNGTWQSRNQSDWKYSKAMFKQPTCPNSQQSYPSATSDGQGFMHNSTKAQSSHAARNASTDARPASHDPKSAAGLNAIAQAPATQSNQAEQKPSTSTSTTIAAAPIAPQHSQVAPPGPPQESFFKSIHKRLQFLEANSTLSLQYIESQSQLLRDAFGKVEKRNIAKTSAFLDTLNSTVLSELARFKTEYEQLWQSTVLELSSQREEGKKERDVLGERVKLLADEMVAQKRLMAVQATLLLLCLGFVVFSRSGSSSADHTGLMQGLEHLVRRHKKADSTGRRWPWESPFASPPLTRPSSKLGHSRHQHHRHHKPQSSIDDGSPDIAGRTDSDREAEDMTPGISGRGKRAEFDEDDNEYFHDAAAAQQQQQQQQQQRRMEIRSAPTTPRHETPPALTVHDDDVR